MKDLSFKTDETLVELTLLGNDSAYSELVTRHEKAVKGTAYKVTGNEFSAEDASQDAFVSAWMHLSSLNDPAKFRPWVCSIAKNSARRLEARYRSAIPDISLSLLEDTDLERIDGIIIDNERETVDELHEAVDALGEKIREAVKLHYFEDLSVSKIAAKLAVPEGTVKRRLYEGRKILRKGFGVMEKEYNENESLTRRVLRQVEHLKLWKLKNDKTGFEEEFKEVLSSAEALDDSKEKSHALADILMLGYWWLPGQKNEETVAQIKEHAEKSRNEEVMQFVLSHEQDEGILRYPNKLKDRIEFIKEEQIPYIEKLGMKKTLAYLYFWLGYALMEDKQSNEGLEGFEKVLGMLEPTDVYYANALAAIELEKKRIALGLSKNDRRYSFSATGEELRKFDSKIYFWKQPGYSRGQYCYNTLAVFYYASRCDEMIFDPAMKVGEVRTASDGSVTLKCVSKNAEFDTPAGKFTGCVLFRTDFNDKETGYDYTETAFCPGVGIVYQKVSRFGVNVFKLKSFTIKGGEGTLPLAVGNRWEYEAENEFAVFDFSGYYEVTGCDDSSTAVISSCSYAILTDYNTKTWLGNMVKARQEYVYADDDNNETLVDVTDCFERAEKLAVSKREKLHTGIARDVMERILRTDPTLNPDYKEAGRWNFFTFFYIEKKNEKILLNQSNRQLSFEWKDMSGTDRDEDSKKVLYNFLYDILQDAAGCVWDEKWIPGYAENRDFIYREQKRRIELSVAEDETVETPAGRFEGCRHVQFELKAPEEKGTSYRRGRFDYWFAPGIGIVKMRRPLSEKSDAVWVLTDYSGTGEGFFPAGDGFRRKYEPDSVGNGWHAQVEYTFDEDENSMIVFHNALGTQDRANYEAGRKK
ncbi:MAG: RNA polymerase sigma factor [Clostridia bacterium]|nr:RNA polymerase sigma factor [Clostridia bacterium]